MTRAAPAFCLLLAACTSATPPAPSVQFIPDASGLAVEPSGLRIDFGRSPDGVEAALDRVLGPHDHLALEPCPAQIMDRSGWGDLELTFTAERFVGWKTADGQHGVVCAG
ncbi:hypothetical protein [Aliiroseovarius subalbicans]|uniref:hypothetical protein n=1 Tax=Aliiroseovarius subalbicans TaxID=2925840 RepID=UPI001F59C437|nr:hypothetical protein [Aliiroseovarius subalbicans]MCI2400025.1 hypothetical protein [Aliiroseovarius subalbicans]